MKPQKQPPKLSLMRLRESRLSNRLQKMLWLQIRLNKMPPKRQPMRPPQRQLLMPQLQRKHLMLQLHRLLRIRQQLMLQQQRWLKLKKELVRPQLLRPKQQQRLPPPRQRKLQLPLKPPKLRLNPKILQARKLAFG